MTFTLDTSGEVRVPSAHGGTIPFRWGGFTLFAQGYGRAMAQALYESLIAEGMSEADALAAVAFRNWHPSTLALMLQDCEAQVKGFAFVGIPDPGADVGREFWRMRQLACAGPCYPPLTLSLNDEGRVCLREAA